MSKRDDILTPEEHEEFLAFLGEDDPIAPVPLEALLGAIDVPEPRPVAMERMEANILGALREDASRGARWWRWSLAPLAGLAAVAVLAVGLGQRAEIAAQEARFEEMLAAGERYANELGIAEETLYRQAQESFVSAYADPLAPSGAVYDLSAEELFGDLEDAADALYFDTLG